MPKTLQPNNPVQPDFKYAFTDVEIAGSVYDYEIVWNDRLQVWLFTLRVSQTGEVILNSVPMVVDYLLGWRKKHINKPKGHFMLKDITLDATRPTDSSLGFMHKLLFFAFDEMGLLEDIELPVDIVAI